MARIMKGGELIFPYNERLPELQTKIAGLKLTNSFGLVRRLAVKDLFEATQEITFIAQRLATEAGVFKAAPAEEEVNTLPSIVEKVNEYFKVDILVKTRKREFVIARHAAAYLAKKYTSESLQTIANAIGQTDHTSAIHSIQSCENMMDCDNNYRYKVQELDGYFWAQSAKYETETVQ